MVQVLRVDAAARILHRDLAQAGGLLPPDADAVPRGCVVQSVFDKVANGLGQPCLVAEKGGLLVPLKAQLLLLLLRPEGILPPDLLQQFAEVLLRRFEGDGPRVQPGHL